jgi:AbrB family looped-hinge helix DNA binding protein
MQERFTVVTRKGQITLPAEIRRKLHIQQGDKMVVREEHGQIKLAKAPSVIDTTFGAVSPRRRPEDLRELREQAIADMAENAAREGCSSQP